jgi:hypothetical protein
VVGFKQEGSAVKLKSLIEIFSRCERTQFQQFILQSVLAFLSLSDEKERESYRKMEKIT